MTGLKRSNQSELSVTISSIDAQPLINGIASAKEAIMRLEQSDHTTPISTEQWNNALRQLRESKAFTFSGMLTPHGTTLFKQYAEEEHRTEEPMIWTGVDFIPRSEVERMLEQVEQRITYFKRCRRLGKALYRNKSRYHVEYRARKISKRRRHE